MAHLALAPLVQDDKIALQAALVLRVLLQLLAHNGQHLAHGLCTVWKSAPYQPDKEVCAACTLWLSGSNPPAALSVKEPSVGLPRALPQLAVGQS